MDRSLDQVSETARAVLGVAGLLALRPFEPELIPIALEISSTEANRYVGELVDYGLMLRSDTDYQLTHSLVHTYARERLALPHGTSSRLAEHFNTFIREQSVLGLPGFVLLDEQRAHILAVQSACSNDGEWRAVQNLTWGIEDYLDLQGHWTERVLVVEAGLNAARADGVRYDEGAFLNSLGIAYADLGEPRRAIEFYEQHLKIAREIGDLRGEGNALFNSSLALHNLDEKAQAIDRARSALRIFAQIESPHADMVRRKLAEWQE